ncbi:MAG: histidine kinase [Thermoleophilia bacterium]|nr:histidine kinase [Thermoleophilia bacterium]
MPLLRDGRVALLVIALLFAAVTALRISFSDPDDGVGVLICLPITIAAIRFGLVGGVLSALTAFSIFVGWTLMSDTDSIPLAGYIPRFIAVMFIGVLVGYFARLRAELDVRSRLLFSLSPDLMGTLDVNGNIIDSNEAWSWVDHSLAPGMELASDDVVEQLRSGAATRFDEEVTRVDGARQTIEWQVRQDPHHALRYLVGRDVTERNERAEHVRELLASSQDTRAGEREQVAGELHDTVLQQLLVALMHLNGGGTNGAPESADRLVREAINALRRVMDDIQPLDVEHLSSSDMFALAASQVESSSDVRITTQIAATSELSGEHRLLAYRVASEALLGAAKHARADLITFEARDTSDGLELRIQDDGRGLRRRVDAENMLVREVGDRLNLLLEQVIATGGHCSITSAPSQGTAVRILLPNP